MARVASSVAVAIVAVAVGFYLGARYVGEPMRTLSPILASAWLGERAALLFHEGSYAEAQATLLKYAETQQELAARPDLGLVSVAQSNLAMTFMRLALLEERRGNTEGAERYTAQAVAFAKQAHWKQPTAERIRWLVENLEKHALQTPSLTAET